MWWKVVLQVAVSLGLDKWAKNKAKDLVSGVKKKALDKIKGINEAAGGTNGEAEGRETEETPQQ